MVPIGFANPWEHLRLLSDPARNQALVTLLERRAPGARVAEIGCGTGLLSLIAARLGARKVYAIEPTELWETAAQLVIDNGLQDVIEVLEGRIEDLEPRPVDLAFSELLNADPFFEGIVSAMQAASRWSERLAPHRLRVHAALVAAPDSARESRAAKREIAAMSRRFDLRLDGLLEEDPGSYRYFSTADEPISSSTVVWDIPLGGEDPPEVVAFEVTPTRAGPAAGVTVWFEASLDGELTMANPPGGVDHWGRLVCAWADERGVREGVPVRLVAMVDDGEIDVTWEDG